MSRMVCLIKVFGLRLCVCCLYVVLNRIFIRFSSDLFYNLQAFELMLKVNPDTFNPHALDVNVKDALYLYRCFLNPFHLVK